MTIQDLIAKQEAIVDALKKRIAGIDAMMAQGSQERNALVADVLLATGILEGLQKALYLALVPEKKEEPHGPIGSEP